MINRYYKLSNPEFAPWLKNFIEVVTANQADLPITPAQITSLQSYRDGARNEIRHAGCRRRSRAIGDARSERFAQAQQC